MPGGALTADGLCALVRAGDVASLRAQPPQSSLITANTSDGHTPLHWAALADDQAILSLLLPVATPDVASTAPSQLGQTPLHWAVVSAPLHAVQALLEGGADPSRLDAKGYSAVAHAAQYGRVDVLHILLAVVPGLVDFTDALGHTPLMWAAYYGHHPAVSYLLVAHGVEPSVPDSGGMTALHRAVQCDASLVAEALLRAGADMKARDADERTALDCAVPGTRTRALLSAWGDGSLSSECPVRERRTPQRLGLVIFYYCALIASYYVYLSIRPGVPRAVDTLGHVCVVISLCAHLLATCRDPGDIKRGTRESLLAYVEKCIVLEQDARLLPSAFCYSCLAERPPRSKHSRERDVCVRRFDHECPWVNNTVGLRTHQPLLALVVSTAIAEVCYIHSVAAVIIRYAAKESLIDAVLHWPFMCMLAVLHSVFLLFCAAMFFTHARLIAKGMTTYEQLVAMKENSQSNPYNYGVWDNIIAFLTCSGPGTGQARVKLSAQSLRQVVFSTSAESVTRNSAKETYEADAEVAEEREELLDEV